MKKCLQLRLFILLRLLVSLFLGMSWIASVSVTASAESRLRVISYNVWGLPEPLITKPSRLLGIAQNIPDFDADVISFQEAFAMRAKILSEMPGYPYHAWGPEKGGTLRQSSGLLLVSKWPIIETDVMRYSACEGFDCLANKGAIYARIRVDGIGEVDVFDTHLNAGLSNYEVRSRQIQELHEFIRSKSGLRDVILLGDFNSKEGSNEYLDLVQFGNLYDAHARFREEHPALPALQSDGFTFNPKRNANISYLAPFMHPIRVDHVLVAEQGTHRIHVGNSRMIFEQRVGKYFLSDHFGVLVDLNFQ